MNDGIKVAWLLKEAWIRVMDEFRPDCCILATRVAIDVLSKFRVLAMPVACKVTIFNAVMVNRMKDEGRPPQTIQERDEWFDTGSWSVGLGHGIVRLDEGKYKIQDDPKKWPGHLVAVVYDDERGAYILDLTLAQAHRPEGGIFLAPLLIEARADFTSKENSGMEYQLTQPGDADPITAFYQSKASDRSYEKTPDWNFAYHKRMPLTDRLITDMKANWDKMTTEEIFDVI